MAVEEAVQLVVTSSPVDNVLSLLTEVGFFRVVAPFLLIFAVFYGIILKTKVIGTVIGAQPTETKTEHGIVALISLAISFFVIGYSPVVSALGAMIPQTSFLIVVTVLLLLLFAMFGVTADQFNITGSRWKLLALAIPLGIILLAVIGASTGTAIPWLAEFSKFVAGRSAAQFPVDPALQNTMLGLGIIIGLPLIIIGLVIWGGTRQQTPP